MKMWKIRKAMLDALEKWWGGAYSGQQEGKQPKEEIKEPHVVTVRVLSGIYERELRGLTAITGTNYGWVFGKLATSVECPYNDCKKSFTIESPPVICPHCKRISYLGGGTLQKPPKKEITESSATPQEGDMV